MSELPNGWAEVELGRLLEPIQTGDPRKTPDQHFRYVDIGSIDNKTQSIAEPKEICGADAPSRARRFIKGGDVLFSTVRTYLKNIAMVPDELDGQLTSTGIAVLRASQATEPRFVFNLVCSDQFISAVSLKQDGTMYPAISDKDLLSHTIALPPLAEQKRIVAKLDALSARSARARKDLARIDTLVTRYKQAVLSKAFSGDLTKDWRNAKLSDVVSESLIGLVRSKADQSAIEGIPYIRMNHFDLEGNWNEGNLTKVNATQSEFDTYALKPDDLLFNTRNSFELVGKVALWDKDAGTHVYNNNILRIRFKPDVVPKFALLQMQAAPFRTYLESVKSATTSVCAIYQKSLMRAPFLVPAENVQQEIVCRIESAFQKIDKLSAEAKRALELTDKLDEAILAKAFRGELVPQDPNDEPASVLLERIKAERAAAPKAKRGRKKAGN